MKKSIVKVFIFQFIAMLLCIIADFALWEIGYYSFIETAVMPVIILIAGVIVCPKNKVITLMVSTFLFMLPLCFIPQLEFAHDLIKINPEYSYQELILDIELDDKIATHMSPNDETDITKEIRDSVIESVFSISDATHQSPSELYKTRRYHFLLMPIFYLFMLLLLAIVLLSSRPKSKDEYLED